MKQPTGKTYSIFKNGPEYRKRCREEGNAIDFSCFRQLHKQLPSHGFSIKYVSEGAEMYHINEREYRVNQGCYLLTNAFTSCGVVINSPTDVHGVCIELSPALLAEVVAVNNAPSNPYPDRDFYDFLTTGRFFEHTYSAANTNLGRYLQAITPVLSATGFADELQAGEFFYNIAEYMITDQQEIHRFICSLDAVKNTTRKDLLGRLLKGKEMLDDCFTEKISIGEIAQAATMSEYYFIRLFKKVFHCSPHSYIVNKRLQHAYVLLLANRGSVADIAYQCGFTDIYSFSKAFKKTYKISPSEARQSK